jgi:hypothetical protein
MEANAEAPTLATAERVCPVDADSGRRDYPARTLALPACRTSVEGIVSVRVPVKMVNCSAYTNWTGLLLHF